MIVWTRERLEMGVLRLGALWRRIVRSVARRPCGEGCYALDEATEVPVGEVVTFRGRPAPLAAESARG